MLLTDYLFNEIKEIWDKYLKHPFLIELGEGTLDKEKFKRYLIQDYLYLKEYAKVYASGFVKCDNIEDMKFFQESVNGILEDESATHITYLKGFGEKIEELEKYPIGFQNETYTSYMKSIALSGDLMDIIISVLPCAWSYYYIAKEMKEIYKDKLEDNFFVEWIESYSSKEYAICVKENIDFANKLCANVDDIKKEKLKEIFKKGSIYEMGFWDMAYEEAK